MEEFAKSAERGSAAAAQSVVLVGQQMRAYLSVRIDGGIYQDRAANFRFEVMPMLINTGLTPARSIGYVARADVCRFHCRMTSFFLRSSRRGLPLAFSARSRISS
jgi:hypothetical protein